MTDNNRQPKGNVALFDAANFIIDEISPDSITGHFVLVKEGGRNYTLPPIRVVKGQAACLNGVKIRTRFKIKYT
jgi:hypothetical protein